MNARNRACPWGFACGQQASGCSNKASVLCLLYFCMYNTICHSFAHAHHRWNKGQKEGGAASTGRRFGLDGAGDGSRPVRARIQLLVENEEEAEAAQVHGGESAAAACTSFSSYSSCAFVSPALIVHDLLKHPAPGLCSPSDSFNNPPTPCQLLYRAIYSGQKALAGASFAQLITVARLAHGFGVQRCAEMAASQLASATADDLSWDMVEAVFAIPSPCSQLPAFAPLLAAARGRLQAELGDLEATMRDESARGRLMALPLATLTALLSEGATRAACEATVLAVASSWFAEAFADEARQPPGAKEQAAQALAGCVRFARLPPAVLAAVAPRTEWVAAAVGLQQLLDLAAFAAAGAEGQKVMLEDKHGLVATHPHWFRPQRPPSAVAGAAFDVKVTAEELRVAAVKARAECKPGGRVYVRPCPPVFYIGFSWRPQIEVGRRMWAARVGGERLTVGVMLHTVCNIPYALQPLEGAMPAALLRHC